jgi:alpha-D-xyloside xylohydrolase
LRETLRPYIGGLMREAQERGIPPMRPLLLNHPEDPLYWQLETQYEFCGDIIVAPITQVGSRTRAVYAPVGADWMDPYSGRKVAAGSWVTLVAPIAQIPLLFRAEASELQACFLRWQADCHARR